MKILYVVNGYPPRERAGTELYAHGLACALGAGAGFRVFCRAVDRSLPEHSIIEDTVDGVGVTRVVNNLAGSVEPRRYFSDPATDALFGRMLDEFGPDVVHVHHLMGLSGGIAGLVRGRGIPLLVTLHDYWFICPRYQLVDESGRLCRGPEGGAKCARDCPGSLFTIGMPGIFRDAARFVLGRVVPPGMQQRLKQMVRDGRLKSPGGTPAGLFAERAEFLRGSLEMAGLMIAPSGYVRAAFTENGFSQERIRVLPHGISVPAPAPRRESGVVRFGYLGSFAGLKGVPLLIEAFGRLKGGAELHVHGHGGENHEIVVAGLRKLSAGRDVHFHGGYSHAELGGILAGLDAVVVPSLWPETFGIVVREAMSCGVPVIVSDAGALPEAVKDGVDGLVFKCADPDDLAAKMQSFVDSPDLARRLAGGIRPVKGLAEHAAEMAAIYDEMSGQR